MKRIIYSLITVAIAGGAWAKPLTPEQALERMETAAARKAKGAGEAPKYIGEIKDAASEPALYVFTYSGERGFMLLSADDAAVPLVGYSETNGFSPEAMPENVASWISLYATQIQEARGKTPYRAAKRRAGEKAEIAPMLTTTWNQTSPYNNLCPIVYGSRAVTGCVATAMAQVMKYWEYPRVGQGSITYSPTSMDTELSMDFSATEFDWANMLDKYSWNAKGVSVTAVATLMKACGYSVKMTYTGGSSGAYSHDIANALKTYFGYDKGAARQARSQFNSQEAWNNMIYSELQNVGPVILNGQSAEGGHCFVCDGYDGNGYYHINWGWGGLSDGYFLLDYLTPGETGTGGGSGKYDGYNMQQDAVTGIMPPVGRLSCMGITVDNAASDSGNVSGKGYIYRILDPSYIKVSVELRISGGHISSPLYVTGYETDPTTLKNEKKVIDTTFSNNINASDGEVTYTQSLSIPDFNPAKYYTLDFAYDLKGKRTTIDSIKLAASSGVDDVESEEALTIVSSPGMITACGEGETTLELYDTGGRLVASAKGYNPGISTASLAGGAYIAIASDGQGGTRTLKLLLK